MLTFKNSIVILLLLVGYASDLAAQENYEIQVYPSETIEKGSTMVELHSNISPNGLRGVGLTTSERQPFHETLELTHGFTSCFEVGFYQFMNLQPGWNFQMVGTHIRPRIRLPESLEWPVGLSLSAELGWQDKAYSPDSWTLEIRPIIDKDFRYVYLAFNPAFGKSLKGLNQNQPFSFEPGIKIAVHVSSKVDAGIEYYGSMGDLFHVPSFQFQEHMLYGALDLNLHPDWELNLGTGWGLTNSTDQFIVKVILGYRIGGKTKSKKG